MVTNTAEIEPPCQNTSRDALLKAALEIFLNRGFHAARIEDIAQLAGLGKGSVYLHFSTKENLFQAVIDAGIGARLEQAELLASEYAGTATELLATMLHNNLIEFWDSPSSGIYKLVIAESHSFPELAANYHETIIQRAQILIEQILNLGIANGEYRDIDVAYTARFILDSLNNELIQAHAFAEHVDSPFDAHRFIDVLLSVVTQGVGQNIVARSGDSAS